MGLFSWIGVGKKRALKRICYRGGIAEFEIPATWREEYEPSGGATFYEDTPDSGTFRLSVISFSSDGKETGEQMVESFVAKSDYKQLANGLATKSYVKSVEEEGTPLQIYYWEVAIPVEGGNARLAIFSHTVLESRTNDQETKDELQLLEKTIADASFSRKLGVSGDFVPS